ncbi:MAG: hypothetical protein ACJ71N_12470 [Terriglobales bacterium]|jgi:hypothetical protein
MSSSVIRVSVIIAALFLFVTVCIADANVIKPIPVELWHVGDDALSQRLAEKVESAFKRSPDFVLSSGRKQGTLIASIPTNIEWKYVAKQTQVFYNVEFSSVDGKKIGLSKGSCWADELSKCATQIVRDAKSQRRKFSGRTVLRHRC